MQSSIRHCEPLGLPELLIQVSSEGVMVGPMLFADDNLSPLKLQRPEQIDLLLSIYD
jgi:hypothetical protein